MRICALLIALVWWPISEVSRTIFNYFGLNTRSQESQGKGDPRNEMAHDDNLDPDDDHTPPSIPNRSFNATKLTFSSDGEELDALGNSFKFLLQVCFLSR